MDRYAAIKRGSSALLILFVVFVFVMCALFLILYGAHVYTTIRDRVESDFTHRMGVSYITNKLRASDAEGGVSVNGGGSSLRLSSEPDDPSPLYIHIYLFDGNIMEYISEDSEVSDPSNGEVIMAADFFNVQTISGGLRVNVGIESETISYTVSLKSYYHEE